jgi:hypothetical protein
MARPIDPGDSEPATKAELSRLEDVIGARFDAVNGRFRATDDRFVEFDHGLDKLEQQLATLDRYAGARCDEIDRAIDRARTRLDRVHIDLSAEIEHTHRGLRQIVLLGLLGAVISTAVLCFGTLILVL